MKLDGGNKDPVSCEMVTDMLRKCELLLPLDLVLCMAKVGYNGTRVRDGWKSISLGGSFRLYGQLVAL